MSKLVTASIVLGLLVLGVAAKRTPGKQLGLKITGSIYVDNKPLEEGRILFHAEDNQILGCVFKDGKCAINFPQLGLYRVTVDGSNVTRKYSDYKTSPLKFELKDSTENVVFMLPGIVSTSELIGDGGEGGYGGEGGGVGYGE